jgi:hypothetical protein
MGLGGDLGIRPCRELLTTERDELLMRELA